MLFKGLSALFLYMTKNFSKLNKKQSKILTIVFEIQRLNLYHTKTFNDITVYL